MKRFFVPKINVKSGNVKLPPEESRHICKVLRLKDSEQIEIFDEDGTTFVVEIVETDPQGVLARIVEKVASASKPPRVILAQSLLKADKMDLVVQKSVELAAAEIIVFPSKRSVAKYTAAKVEKRLQRWRRIAVEAAKQSGYPGRPEVTFVPDFETLVKNLAPKALGIMLWEEEKSAGLRALLSEHDLHAEVMLIIGPEGGFVEEEMELAEAAGVKIATLGALTLRSETAAIAALAATQFHRGVLGG